MNPGPLEEVGTTTRAAVAAMASTPTVLAAMIIQFIVLHMVDGREVQLNSKEITRMQSGREDTDPDRVLVEGVRCVIWLTDGRYVSVAETCDEVRKLMEETQP